MMAEAKYTTRRSMLIDERNSLSQSIAGAFSALTALMNGKITSYSLGTWSISRSQADLDKLRQWLKDAQARLDEIDNILTGRPQRHKSVCVYANPFSVKPYFGGM